MKFSIIVPIYNVEKYLLQCLESIRSQIYENYECILVNDGSTDSSGLIALNFCKENDVFSYYEKENGGLSDARNFGLRFAKGEYIVFVDSDDLISKRHLSTISNLLKNKADTDIVHIDYVRFNDGDAIEDEQLFDKPQARYISNKKLSQYSNFAWARIAKKELYQNNLFPKGYIYEDAVTSPVLAYMAKKIIKINGKLYFYRRREQSITTGSALKQFQLFDTMKVLKSRCRESNIPLVYYNTSFINLTKSVIISLFRLENRDLFYLNLKRAWKEYQDISLCDGITSNSYLIFKILFVILKMRWIGLPFYFLIEFILRKLKK